MRILQGIDIVEIAGIASLMRTAPDQFLDRSFAQSERRTFNRSDRAAEYYAGVFAAKEAALKALGLGFGDGASFIDVEIGHLPSGQPMVLLHGHAEAKANDFKVMSWTVSISHSGQYAVASVIGFAAAA
jgi:holo-[acyl-carrier protein] synthase